MARLPAALSLLAGGLAALARGSGVEPLPAMAKHGEPSFQGMAAALGNSTEGMSATMQSNPLQFPELTDFWCAWDLTDRKRTPALLVDDMQIEYEAYVLGIVPQVKTLIQAFRKAGLPIFWSTWWRFGPDDGFFNTMDRFYGPIGYQTKFNALYNHLPNGGDILADVAPVTDAEWKRVMHKSYSLDMFDERPMKWLVPDGQETLHVELQKLGVDTIVQVGAWTDDCILATVFHGFGLQYDVVLIEDGVTTASKQHFNAIEVIRGSTAKVLLADQVASYVDGGLKVVPPSPSRPPKMFGGRAARATGLAAAAGEAAAAGGAPGREEPEGFARGGRSVAPEVANLLNTLVVGSLGAAVGYLWGRRAERRGGSRTALLS